MAKTQGRTAVPFEPKPAINCGAQKLETMPNIASKERNILEVALAYRQRFGWSIIPIKTGTKKPAVRSWKPYQQAPADEKQLRRWFGNSKQRSVAVILGQVSGNLACRDFDLESAYRTWAERFGELARTLPTVRTSRGYHVYFTARIEKTIHLDDGELRGNGAYCLLPPGVHPDGMLYEWVVPIPNGKMPEIDPVKAGLAPVSNRQKRTEENRRYLKKSEEIRRDQKAIVVSDEIKLAITAAERGHTPSASF